MTGDLLVVARPVGRPNAERNFCEIDATIALLRATQWLVYPARASAGTWHAACFSCTRKKWQPHP
jgi:hypothetical protein